MTLEQLRRELAPGATRKGRAPQPVPSEVGAALATALYRLTVDRQGGVRLQLPHTQMPVLP